LVDGATWIRDQMQLHFAELDGLGVDFYLEFREQGWQIGSGPTESQCKLCTKRLKGHGRRWDRPNATAVVALDALDRNGQWHQIWPNARTVTT
jgi:hypothetical protein